MTDHKPIRDALEIVLKTNREASEAMRANVEVFSNDLLRFSAACNPQAIEDLLRDLDETKKDAERYRFLRDSHPADDSPWVAMGKPHSPSGLSYWRHEALDAAIDAAIKGATP